MILSIIVSILLAVGAAYGYRTGLFLQIFRLATISLSWIAAIFVYTPVTSFVYTLIHEKKETTLQVPSNTMNIVIFAILFFLFNMILWRIVQTLNLFTSLPVIHLINRLFGSIVGLIIRYLMVFIFLNILITIPNQWIQSQYNHSPLSQKIVSKTPVIFNQLLQKWQD